MSEKEIFNEVLNNFIEKYHLDIEHPYNDGYFVIKMDGKEIGGMTCSGYNLLRNLNELTTILKHSLI